VDRLRSEDLKEEKNITTPIFIKAVHALCRSLEGVPLVMQRMNAELLAPDHSVAADILVRVEPDEEEEDEENGKDKDKDKQDEGDDNENDGYSE
jgi:hypothetical protein